MSREGHARPKLARVLSYQRLDGDARSHRQGAREHVPAVYQSIEHQREEESQGRRPSSPELSRAALSALSHDRSARRQRLSQYVDQLWENVDIDGDGHLNAAEFAGFVRIVCNLEHIVESDCKDFLHYMDTSGNGLIEKIELVEFIGNGLELDANSLKEYGSRSETHQLIVQVFEALHEKLSNPIFRTSALPTIPPVRSADVVDARNVDAKKANQVESKRKKKGLSLVAKLFTGLTSLNKRIKTKKNKAKEMESTKLPAIETEKKQCEDENQRDKKRLVGGVRDSELARMDSAAVKGHQDYLTSEVERYLSKLVCNEIQVGGTTLGSVMSFFASTDGPTNLQVLSRDSFDTVFSRTELSETQAAHLFHRFEIGHTRTSLGQFDVQSFCLAFGTERQTHGHLSEGQPQDNRTDKSLLVLEQQRSQELALQLAEARREVRELKQQHEQQQILQARQEQKEQQQEESHYRLSLGGARDLKNRVERHIQETLEHERTQFLQQQLDQHRLEMDHANQTIKQLRKKNQQMARKRKKQSVYVVDNMPHSAVSGSVVSMYDKDSTSTLPTPKSPEEWKLRGRLDQSRAEVERLRNELNSMRMESGSSPRLLIQQESKEDRDAVKDVEELHLSTDVGEIEEERVLLDRYVEGVRGDFNARNLPAARGKRRLTSRAKQKKIKKAQSDHKAVRDGKRQNRLSAAKEAELVILKPSAATAGDNELEALRKEIVAIILGSRLYKSGSGKSPDVQEKILKVLAKSSLSSTAAHALLYELEETMKDVLPLV